MKTSLKTITVHGLMLALIAISTAACSKTEKAETNASEVSADAKPDDSQEGSEKAKAKEDVAQVKAETDSGVDVTLPEKPDDMGDDTQSLDISTNTDDEFDVTLPKNPDDLNGITQLEEIKTTEKNTKNISNDLPEYIDDGSKSSVNPTYRQAIIQADSEIAIYDVLPENFGENQ